MKKHLFGLPALVVLLGTYCTYGGELSYVAIPAAQSDASSGISPANQYTTALDAGSETNRVVNGVTLNPSPGSGQSIVANNCSVAVSSGSLITTGGATDNIAADGTLREVLSDVIYNSDAADNSQQEIVLDPASLVAGTTYDLRVYIGKGGNGDRQVNLSFVGDGQPPAETGFFNEDDARTSAGGFQDPNQVYCITYRFTWDGKSVPGATVTQKSGQAPFVLYALTNHPVGGAATAAAPPPAPPAQAEQPAAAGPGVSTGLVSAETDQVGVTTDTFYGNESLNKNGRWIEVKKYGRCWQPNNCPSDWRPYWRGTFKHCDDCGWTWVCDSSEEEWGWATYHYGRWCRVQGVGCGWAWSPGTVWSGSWVSWRKGQTPECSCVGWAPLPPEAVCRVNVGISTWVDRECDIGPSNYTFVNVRDFGSDSYHSCGCVLERNRYVNIIEHTVNITNISYTNINVTNVNVTNVNVTNVNIYSGGPDLNWCNTAIRQSGGKEISQIHINRYDDPTMLKGGKQHLDGNTLAILSPNVVAQKNPKFVPKIVEKVGDNKIDHGWRDLKDPKIKTDLQNKIAEQTKGQTSSNTKATTPTPSPAHGMTGATATPGQSPGVGKSPSASPALASGLTGTTGATATPGKSPIVSPTANVTGTKGATASPGQSPSVSPATGKSPSVSPTASVTGTKGATASPGQTPSVSPVTGKSPSVSPTASVTGTKGATASPGPSTAGSPAGSASPTRSFPETYKAPLTLKSVTPGPSASASVAGSASPTRSFPETYKAPLTLKSVTPGPSASASPTRTFPETYKAPLTLKSVTPGPSASASPTRTFPETYKAPLTLKSVTPGPSPSASRTRTFPETYKAPLTLKSVTPGPSPTASPKVIRSAAPTASPAPTIGTAWTPTPKITSTPKPLIMSTPKPVMTSTPKPTFTSTPKPVMTSTPKPTFTSTPKPVLMATPKPIITHTPKPIIMATPKPVLMTTPKPIITHTPKPVMMSTPKPVITHTPVPVIRSTPKPIIMATPKPVIQNVKKPVSPTPTPTPVRH